MLQTPSIKEAIWQRPTPNELVQAALIFQQVDQLETGHKPLPIYLIQIVIVATINELTIQICTH